MRTKILLVALTGTGLCAAASSLAQSPYGPQPEDESLGARAGAVVLAQGGGFDALRARTKGTVGRSDERDRRRSEDQDREQAEEDEPDSMEAAGTTDEPVADTADESSQGETGVGGPENVDLSALEVGLTVRTAAGVEIGTIRRINRSSDGTIRSVIVSRAGRPGNLRLAPETLTISDGIVTTTAELPQP